MRMHPVVKALFLGMGLCLFAALPLRADDVYGRIRGTVTDPSGAVVAGVSLQAINVGTGLAKSATSAADGSFEFLQLLAPANYAVRAQATGFKKYEATGIHLDVGQIYVVNVSLEVGTVRQQVVVEAAATQVEKTSIERGADLTSRDVTELPLVGRNWITLQQTLPGTVASSDRFGNANVYATNGSRSQSNSFMVNGTDANDLPLNTPIFVPSPDSIGEVNIVTNTINPEFGRNSGAILNAVTKSGTNQFHGDGFEFFRDTSLNTRNFFVNSPGASAIIFHQNLFGGTIGGPIWKNHTFFFFSYQGIRNVSPEANVTGVTTVFTADQRNGIFPGIATTTNAQGQVIPNPAPSPRPLVGEDGATHPAGTPYGTLFPTGHIPTTDFDSIAAKLMNTYVPQPNCGSNCAEYDFNPTANQTQDQEIARIDHTFSPKDTLWGYGFIQRFPVASLLPFTGATVPGFGMTQADHRYNYTLSWTHTFGGNALNEARFGYNRFNFVTVFPQHVVQPSSVGFNINPQFPEDASLPRIDLTGYFTLGFSNNGPQPRIDQTYQATDNFSKIVGRHTLKMGFETRRMEVYNPFLSDLNGYFQFLGTGPYSTGDPGADYLLGMPSTYNQNTGDIMNVRARQYYTYFQDQLKARPNLTLTYGLGWQVDTPLVDNYHHGEAINCFIPGEQSKVFPTAPPGLDYPGDPGCSESGYYTHYGHLGPRAGFAWSPDTTSGRAGKTSLRGGFGIYFNRTEEELTLQNLGALPWGLMSTGIADVGGSPSFDDPWHDVSTTAAIQSIPNKFPYANPTMGSNVNFNAILPTVPLTTDSKFSVPYAMNYNLTVEREVPGSIIASVGYVGSEGRKLQGIYNINFDVNPAACAADPVCVANRTYQKVYYPQYSRFPSATASGIWGIGSESTYLSSNYNSLQVTFNKRTSHGLSFLASYTWAHTLDYSSSLEDDSFAGLGLDPTNFRSNYGNAGIDASQRFTASYVYDFPGSKWAASNFVADRVINGWEISGITTFQSGFPVQIYESTYRELRCDGVDWTVCPDRPNQVGPIVKVNPRTSFLSKSLSASCSGSNPASSCKTHYYFNPQSFALEPIGTVGDVGRNPFHGPGINNFDWALYKNVKLVGESKFIQLRFEFYNIWNHTQFSSVAILSSASNVTNGNAASSNFGRVTQAFNPRLIQLAAKIYF